jgi:hypothetical protein
MRGKVIEQGLDEKGGETRVDLNGMASAAPAPGMSDEHILTFSPAPLLTPPFPLYTREG